MFSGTYQQHWGLLKNKDVFNLIFLLCILIVVSYEKKYFIIIYFISECFGH